METKTRVLIADPSEDFRRMLADKKNKSMTITEIASRCGFDSMTTFYRCRKEFGL